MKKTFLLAGLDCANCAAKLERAIAALEGVTSANVDFMHTKLTLEAAESELDALTEQAAATIARLEPGVSLQPYRKGAAKPGARCAVGGGECCGCEHEHEHAHHHEHAHPHADEPDENEEPEDAPPRDEAHEFMRTQSIRILASGVILVAAVLLPEMSELTSLLMFLVAYLMIGADILWRAIKNMLHGKLFDENFLMAIATVGAFFIREYPEAVAVMLFYQIGELFQYYAVNHSRKSIAGLMDIRPDYANVLLDGELVTAAPEAVELGDVIVVKAGEKIPLDGRVLEGASSLDTSALTGEALPRDVKVGSEVLNGCINLSGVLTLEVTREYGESTVAKILELVENAGSKKASAENFITKFAHYYTPAVVGVAVLLAVLPPLLFSGVWSDWIYRALSFLVVSCPCALVISIPLGFFGGIGGASKQGILIKGGNYLEALAATEIVVFDKTGTLTKGSFRVVGLYPQGVDEARLLELAATAEVYSNHPISRSIKEQYGTPIDRTRIGEVEELSGYGVRSVVDGKTVLAGNARLMQAYGVPHFEGELAGTVVHVAEQGVYAGYLLIADEVKPDAKQAIAALRAGKVTRTIMLTGDKKAVGEAVATELGLDEVYTELLPGDKVAKLEELLLQTGKKGKLAFVGDGINDAPVLARADIGIAMGGLGSDAAIEAADIVIMTDEPSRIATAIAISRKTLRIVKENIVFAFVVKLAVLVLVALGVSTMWEAVFADVGVSVLAILNSMRALRVKKPR